MLLFGYTSFQNGSAARNEAQATARSFARFRESICALQAQQMKGSRGFVKLLRTLDNRAVAREHVDARNGNATAAAADGDSARLYQSVLDSYAAAGTRPNTRLSC